MWSALASSQPTNRYAPSKPKAAAGVRLGSMVRRGKCVAAGVLVNDKVGAGVGVEVWRGVQLGVGVEVSVGVEVDVQEARAVIDGVKVGFLNTIDRNETYPIIAIIRPAAQSASKIRFTASNLMRLFCETDSSVKTSFPSSRVYPPSL